MYAYVGNQPTEAIDPSGLETMGDAIRRYLSGKGGTVDAPMSEIDGKRYGPTDFPGFEDLARKLAPGQSATVDLTRKHQLHSLRRPYGRVFFRLKGVLRRDSCGKLHFEGLVSVDDDRWDFNPNDGRDAIGEAETAAGGLLPGKPFTYHFPATRPVTYEN